MVRNYAPRLLTILALCCTLYAIFNSSPYNLFICPATLLPARESCRIVEVIAVVNPSLLRVPKQQKNKRPQQLTRNSKSDLWFAIMDSKQSDNPNTLSWYLQNSFPKLQFLYFPTSISVVPPYLFVSEVIYLIHYANKPQIEEWKLNWE